MDGDKPDTIPTNLRLLLVIEEVARAGAPVTPTEINAILGLPKPTIHRLFSTLENEGFLQRDLDGRSFAPGPRLTGMAGGVLSTKQLRTMRQAVMTKLSRQIGETCNLALPDGDAMLYLERVETEWPLRIQLPVGTRVPLYCTASGKMYLSSLSTAQLKKFLAGLSLERRTENTLTDRSKLVNEVQAARKNGYAQDRQEFMDQMVALAVPVLDTNGRLMATLSFHAPSQRISSGHLLEYLAPLSEAARELSAMAHNPA